MTTLMSFGDPRQPLSPVAHNSQPFAACTVPHQVEKADIAMQIEATPDHVDDTLMKPVLHVEARLKAKSNIRADLVRKVLRQWLADWNTLCQDSLVPEFEEVDMLKQHLDQLRIAECVGIDAEVVHLDDVELEIHVYQPSIMLGTFEMVTSNAEDTDDNAATEDVQAASVTDLPNILLDNLWANLFYDDAIKESLLNFIYSTLIFSSAGVDFDIISYNRMALLYGPPGSGKTSLAKALAQKLSIRLSSIYSHGKIVEINAHSLFSKWFSESGKLVQKLFAGIMEMVEEQNAFVVVLIDEVESLTSAREGAISGKEPSDALRVVNALLTNLDKLKTKKNVMVVTTSNLSHSIDPAFIDRADIKQYIGLPSKQAVYWILSSCMHELISKGLVGLTSLLDWKSLVLFKESGIIQTDVQSLSQQSQNADERQRKLTTQQMQKQEASAALYELAELCWENNMSGRFLRRLPILCHSRHLIGMSTRRLPIVVWISKMKQVVREEVRQMQLVSAGTCT